MTVTFDPPPTVRPTWASVDHASAPFGERKVGGITPATVVGVPSRRIVRPITPESPLPQAVAQDHGARAVRLILLGEEGAAEGRRNAEDTEVFLRDAQGVDG